MWFLHRLHSNCCLTKLNFNCNSRCQSSLSIVFYGSDRFSLSSLKALHQQLKLTNDCLIKRLDIVTKSDRNLVSQFAVKHGLMVHHWPYELKKGVYDLGVVVSFGQLIDGPSILNCKYGMINVHPSLLPKYRGSSPIQKAVLNGDTETGLSIVTIEPNKFDIGRILIQERYPIPEGIKAIDLSHELAEFGAELLIKSLTNLEDHLGSAMPQSNQGVSYAKKLKKTDGHLNWSTMTTSDVDRRFRAFDGFITIYCDWIDGSTLRLMDMVDFRLTRNLRWEKLEQLNFGSILSNPGLVMYNKRLRSIAVKCKDGLWVAFKRIGLKNYEQMDALEFKNGFISKYRQPLILPSSPSNKSSKIYPPLVSK